MKNRKNRRKFKNRISAEKLKEMMKDESQQEKLQEIIKNIKSEKDFNMFMDIDREIRMDTLFDNLNIDKNDLEKAKKQLIKLHPNSVEYPLMSTLFRNHKGKYKVEHLFNEYHDSTIRDGLMVGIEYGKKFIVEDIQNKRFTKEDILKMSEDEVFEYCDEDREEI